MRLDSIIVDRSVSVIRHQESDDALLIRRERANGYDSTQLLPSDQTQDLGIRPFTRDSALTSLIPDP